MGVQGLWKLLESTGRPVNPETLEGKILAVDISIWLNQAIKGARDRQGNAIQNAHLLTLFHRLCKLLFFRIRPIFVFDGEAPGLKKRTLALRRQRKTAATQDSTKTTEKLLKTFLQRQAIKAVLIGKSDEAMPSLSQVRREEVDDIYLLPALDEQEKKSSDEEEEKEWEERMTQRQQLQEEFLEDPRAVDIESEDFSSLPPEVKHDILTDLKELTKRRRTIFERMPEESNDFSQYQLKGLLKKNVLNRHIETVQKEMNQQVSGDLSALYENEGGFLKNVESKRVMSEDASHYVLIKGLKSKKEGNQEDVPGSSSTMVMHSACTEISPGISAGPHPLSPVKPELGDSSAGVAPPSPRTMLAIQAAMMESSSDEEAVGGPVTQINKDLPYPSAGSADGNVSPRTFQAIQQALNEDIDVTDYSRHISINVSDEKQIGKSGAKVLLVSSSDEEDVVPEITAEEEPAIIVYTTNSILTENVELDKTKTDLENTMVYPEKCTIMGDAPVTSTATEREVMESKQQFSLNVEHQPFQIQGSPDEVEDVRKDVTLPPYTVSLGFNDLGTAAFTKGTEDDSLLKSVLQMEAGAYLTSEILGSRRSPEEKVNVEAFENKESDSESEDGFIEVDSDLSDHSLVQLEPVQDLLTVPEAIPPLLVEASPTVDQENVGGEMNNTMGDGAGETSLPGQQEAEAAEEGEPAVNEWHDISLEELETLESNLLVQQGTLQAQKQQQERIAATVTGQMYLESQELLRLFGVPFIVAPTEAEAQCAILDLTDQTSGTITDDSDIWLFGARHVYKNFFSQNKYVEYYQYVDIHNQLGLDRNKLINLAYLLGSDYTDGIPTVGCVTAMEILNEFAGHGLQPLIDFREWWAEAQQKKKIRPNPNDTKVKKKIRELELHPSFPNLAVAEAYLKPVVDDSKGAFSWGRPNLEQIREFCETAFGWYRSKTDDILLPVLKQLNAQQTQLRIDSFFRMEQHEKRAIKSQRLRRAVTCMQRKEKEGEIGEMAEVSVVLDNKLTSPEKKKGKRAVQDTTTVPKCEMGKKKKVFSSKPESRAERGGFLDGERIPEPEKGSSSGDSECESAMRSNGKQTLEVPKSSNVYWKTVTRDESKNAAGDRNNSSSSGDDEEKEKAVMVTARSVFENKVVKSRRGRGRKRKN